MMAIFVEMASARGKGLSAHGLEQLDAIAYELIIWLRERLDPKYPIKMMMEQHQQTSNSPVLHSFSETDLLALRRPPVSAEQAFCSGARHYPIVQWLRLYSPGIIAKHNQFVFLSGERVVDSR
ncbi:hypothetical protein HU724_014115 [Pseudomonas iranensis]|uniref:hypothetical protein n=1 Tax=Pseudomonas iranensis TaxID=2745503 RepID=UPI0016442BB0|nr:hypothetical protein [Pseudomonas iranensis]QXI20181.1 hypothetical protein HU724_014115 [Pseudomonas iranensis]